MKTLFWWVLALITASIIFCTGIIIIPMQTKIAEKIELTYIFVDENWHEYDIFEPIHWAATDWSFLFGEDSEDKWNTWNITNNETPKPIETHTWSIPDKDYLAEIIESESNVQTLLNTWNTNIDNIKDIIDELIYVKENPEINNYESCTTPWNANINHGESIIAYEQRKDVPNICNAQKRTCNNGILNWSYQQWACKEDVEYKYTRVKVISYNNKQPWDLVQNPKYAKNDSAKFDTDGKINPEPKEPKSSWDNNVNDSKKNESTTNLSKKWYYNCSAPWWEIVQHGQFVKSYQSQLWFVDQQCQVQLRLCIDWKLNGNYGFKKCNHMDITYQDYKWWNDDITVPTDELITETLIKNKKWWFFNWFSNLFN